MASYEIAKIYRTQIFNMAKITQNVVFLNGKTVDSITGNDWTSKDGETTGTFKQAVDNSDTIVFESHGTGNEHLNAIYAHGQKFGGGVAVNTDANGFVANGANYSLVVNNGKLEIQKFVPITSASASGTDSWERDSGTQTATWTGSYAPSDASATVAQSWTVDVQGGATIDSNSGNTITFTTIPANATVTCTFSATQNDVTKTKTKSTSWWTRKAAVIISDNANLTVTGNTTGGFSFTINGTTCTTGVTGIDIIDNTPTGGYIPGTNKNGLSEFTSSKSFGGTYTGYIYVLQADNVESFSKYITKNGKKGLAEEIFTQVSTTPIKTYSGEKQSLYLYRSNGQQADISTIALTDN